MQQQYQFKILKRLSSLFILLLLISCTSKWTDTPTSLIPRDGLVEESIFNGDVYLKMRGNTSGPVVVLIHGLGDDASNIWEQTIEKLESNYFLVTLDLPGFGRSSKSNQLYSPENYVELVRQLTQRYVNKPFHLVGHSMGGAISLRYAATYENDLNSLTLIDAAGILHRLAYTKYLAPLGLKPFSKYINFDNKDVSSLAGLILNKLDGFMAFNLSSVIQNPTFRSTILRQSPSLISAMALVLDDFSQIPQRVKTPTQIIWGENDQIAPIRTAYVLNALIPNSTLRIIEDAGHVPIRNNEDLFHHHLLDGLNDNSANLNNSKQTTFLQREALCSNENNISFSGKIDSLTIINCKNVYIHDAQLRSIQIKNSRVFIQNTEIRSKDTALKVEHSTVEITAATIAGEVAIDTYQSRLDIAGSHLIGNNQVIVTTSNQPSNAIFSLTSISNRNYKNKILHGQMKISSE